LFDIALPETKYGPSHLFQLAGDEVVPGNIPLKFFYPIILVRRLDSLHYSFQALLPKKPPMPVVSVHEYCDSRARKNDIRLSR
jgi:hypothetical protein